MVSGSWRLPGIASVAHAAASVIPQLLALVLLAPGPFGLFALGYLFFALGSSFVLSFLCDAWLVRRAEGADGGWAAYSTVAVAASLAVGGLAAGVLAVLTSVPVALMTGAAVGLSTYRTCLRYRLVGTGRWRQVLRTDVQTLAGLAVGGLGMLWVSGSTGLWLVLVTWVTGAVAGVLVGPGPRWAPRPAVSWMRSSRGTIRPLLIDSVVADASSIGVPFLMVPILGMQGFGVYRAVANLSAPVRLVAAPLRPALVAHPLAAMAPRHRRGVLLLALLAGLTTWVVLRQVSGLDGDGVLLHLAGYPVAVGLYLAGSVLLSYFPFVCRARPGRPLRLGRLVNTGLGILLPLVGVALADLDGAVWGFACAALLSGLVWQRMAVLSTRGGQR